MRPDSSLPDLSPRPPSGCTTVQPRHLNHAPATAAGYPFLQPPAGPDEIGPPLLSLASPLARSGANAAGALLTDGFNLDQFERDLLRAALERTNGNKSAAARLLGITQRRLYSRLESLEEPGAGSDNGEKET